MGGWEGPVIGAGLDVVSKGLKSLKRKGQTRKQKAVLSAVIAELLKIDPDITTSEANLLALKAVGVRPSPDLLRAEEMLDAVKAHKRKKAAKKAAPKRARRKTAKKRAVKKR